MTTGRVPCCIPFCRRTFKPAYDDERETICGKHWRTGDRHLRQRHTKLMRRYKRLSMGDRNKWRLAELLDRIWGRVRQQATERAAGISA